MSVQTEMTRIKNAVTAIVNAIKGKGVTVPSGTKIDGVSQYIDAITTPNLQSKTVSPLTSAQTVKPDSSYNGLSQVTVNAMPSATQATPSISVSSAGLITASATQPAGYVAAGTKSATKQLTARTSSSLTSSGLTVTAPAGYYHSNATKTLSDSNLVASNIKKGVSIFGVAGSYEGSGGASVATCTVNISASISINSSNFVVGATIFQNGTVYTFSRSGANYNISIPNVVCGSTLFLSVGMMSSIYGWPSGYNSSWDTTSHVLYVPNTAGTYSAEIGMLDD